jgi:hypothetical protein
VAPRSLASSGGMLLVLGTAAAIGSPVAHAEEAPSFSIGGTRLVSGKTHNGDARAIRPFVDTNALGSFTIECSEVGTEEGVALGSNPDSAPKSLGIAVFSGCKNAAGSNGAKCHLAPSEGSAETTTVIKSEPLIGLPVENVVNGTKGNQLLGEIIPAKGATFASFFFGGECTLLIGRCTGQVVGEVLLDNGTSEPTGKVELGQAVQEHDSWDMRFPSTPITQVWLISNGIGTISKTEETVFGAQAITTGTALALLASTKFAPEPNALWSPLP